MAKLSVIFQKHIWEMTTSQVTKKWLFHLEREKYKIKVCHESGFYGTFEN